MKKIVATVICLVALGITALPLNAQTRSRCVTNGSGYDRRYDSRYDYRNRRDVNRNDVYRNDQYGYNDYRYSGYGYDRNRSVWREHQDKLTTAGGAVAGALLGGLVGGRRGAVIGAVTGGGGAALYTYKLRNRGFRRY